MTHKHSHSSLGLLQLLHHQLPPRTGVEGGVGVEGVWPVAAWHAFLRVEEPPTEERFHLAGGTLTGRLAVRGGLWRSITSFNWLVG